jgi:hypothetical protein
LRRRHGQQRHQRVLVAGQVDGMAQSGSGIGGTVDCDQDPVIAGHQALTLASPSMLMSATDDIFSQG